jgi:hypothetical protein
MRIGLKITALIMLSAGLLGCQTTAKKETLDPSAIQGFAHFDSEGSISATITDNTIKFYKGKTQAFVRDGECENFQGASGIICYDRARNLFKQNDKIIGKFAPFASERAKVIKAKPTVKPTGDAAANTSSEAATAAQAQTAATTGTSTGTNTTTTVPTPKSQ